MKSKTTSLVILLFILNFCYAQDPHATFGGGEYIFNASQTPCLTIDQRNSIKQELTTNIAELSFQNKLTASSSLNRGGQTLFIWPIQKADNVIYNDVWGISGYVDHNPAYPNQHTDYNCGTKTYDNINGYNHQGVDIFSWPFGWKLQDDDSVEIIAAAPGQIIAKNDGEFDRSCNFNNNIWNAVYVQHTDGSVAWYGHMKNGSLTTKSIGDSVALGEYLGIVGSSGNSTGPHLHFEVYTDATFTQLVDPYVGPCNAMNSISWWVDQKPYKNPNINAVLTHTNTPIFPNCPTQEIPYESNDFDASDTITFGLYMRDQENDTSVDLKILRPDNSEAQTWIFDFEADYNSSWWYWNYSGIYDINGQWKWQATYQGQTVTHNFNVTGALSVKDEDLASTLIYPNPFNTVIKIDSKTKINSAIVVDVLGKRVLEFSENSDKGLEALNLSQLSNGMYFLILEGDNNQRKTVKLIKK